MKQFDYTIKDPIGIHARPAGNLAKLAKSLGDSVVTLTKGDMTVKASQLMKVMSMGIKCGDQITVGVEGGNEAESVETMRKFFEENL